MKVVPLRVAVRRLPRPADREIRDVRQDPARRTIREHAQCISRGESEGARARQRRRVARVGRGGLRGRHPAHRRGRQFGLTLRPFESSVCDAVHWLAEHGTIRLDGVRPASLGDREASRAAG